MVLNLYIVVHEEGELEVYAYDNESDAEMDLAHNILGPDIASRVFTSGIEQVVDAWDTRGYYNEEQIGTTTHYLRKVNIKE